ncbi:MAG: hypothetical protein IJM14_07895 [Lachnospiraceae bacterium]|nr:hypothetical protein [Lachnospiraceae bacterium]
MHKNSKCAKKEAYKKNNKTISKRTVYNYLEKMKKAYLLPTEATIQREFGAYSKITDASPKYVMSLDKIDMSHDGIVHLNIIDFLLRRKDLMLT